MNTGQMMLVGMALVLLGTTVLSVNKNSLNNGTVLRQTELGIYAVSLATSYIQKASELDWDANTYYGLVFITVPMPTTPPSNKTGVCPGSSTTYVATPPGNLGPETGLSEIANVDTSYNDFDDYNGFSKDVAMGASSESASDTFHVAAQVYYVSQAPINGKYTKVTANATWQKQMDIKVNSKINRKVFSGESAGTDTIRLSYIYAFYR